MSEQHGPSTEADQGPEATKRRKARRDKATRPTAEDYAPGDLIMVENKGRDGFLVHALAAVVDVLDFAPLRQWRSPFSLIVRIMLVSHDTFEPCVSHLFPVNTETDTNYYFDRSWRLSKLPMEDLHRASGQTITIKRGDALG